MFVKSLNAEEYNKLINYLISKPYREVAPLIAMLSAAEDVKVPEEKKTRDKMTRCNCECEPDKCCTEENCNKEECQCKNKEEKEIKTIQFVPEFDITIH